MSAIETIERLQREIEETKPPLEPEHGQWIGKGRASARELKSWIEGNLWDANGHRLEAAGLLDAETWALTELGIERLRCLAGTERV